MPSKTKVKPYLEEVIALVIDFVENKLQQHSIAQQLRQKYEQKIPRWIIEGNPLLSKGLPKIIKGYAQNDQDIVAYYHNRKQNDEQDEPDKEKISKKSKTKNGRKNSEDINIEEQNAKINEKKNTKGTINDGKHHDNTSHWVINKFEAPKKLEQIGVQEHLRGVEVTLHKKKQAAVQFVEEEERQSQSEEKPKKKEKKQKKKKVKKQQSSQQQQEIDEQPKKKHKIKESKKTLKKHKQPSSEEQVEEEEIKPQKKSKKQAKKIKKQEKKQQKQIIVQKVQQKLIVDKRINNRSSNKQIKQSFSRINVEEVGEIPEHLRDNTFQAKFKYGSGGDQWGKFGYEKLKDTRGDSFKKTKGKLKNKAFQGANIDFNAVNSIKL